MAREFNRTKFIRDEVMGRTTKEKYYGQKTNGISYLSDSIRIFADRVTEYDDIVYTPDKAESKFFPELFSEKQTRDYVLCCEVDKDKLKEFMKGKRRNAIDADQHPYVIKVNHNGKNLYLIMNPWFLQDCMKFTGSNLVYWIPPIMGSRICKVPIYMTSDLVSREYEVKCCPVNRNEYDLEKMEIGQEVQL